MAGPGRLVHFFTFLFYSSLFLSVIGVPRKEIIDDANDKVDTSARTRLSFYPPKNGHWNSNGGCAEGSPSCLRADPNQAQEGTWTSTALFQTTNQRKITIEFVGDEIAVYFILVSRGLSNYTTRCTFILDGKEDLNKLERVPSSPTDETAAPEFSYKQKVYDPHNLKHGPHKLEIVAPAWSNGPNYLNFDYAEYKFDDALLDPQSAPSPNGTAVDPGNGAMQAAIIGGSVSGAILVVSVILFLVYRARRRIKQQPMQSDKATLGVPSTYAGSTKKLSLPFWPHKPSFTDAGSNFRNAPPFPEKRRSDVTYASYPEKYPEYILDRDPRHYDPSRLEPVHPSRRDRESTISHGGPLLSPANALMQSFYPNSRDRDSTIPASSISENKLNGSLSGSPRKGKRESATTGKLSRLEAGMSPESSVPRHLSSFSEVRAMNQKRAEDNWERQMDTGITLSSSNVLPMHSPSSSSESFIAGSQTPQS